MIITTIFFPSGWGDVACFNWVRERSLRTNPFSWYQPLGEGWVCCAIVES